LAQLCHKEYTAIATFFNFYVSHGIVQRNFLRPWQEIYLFCR